MNESILLEIRASDKWAYYQSKSTKSHVASGIAALATYPTVRQRFVAEWDLEDNERIQVQRDASRLNRRPSAWHAVRRQLRPRKHLPLALGFIQVVIALAAVNVLTRRR